MGTCFCWEDIYTYHEMGFLHPESPKRLLVINEVLEGDGVGRELTCIKAPEASHEEIALIHDENYIKRIEGTDGVDITHLDPDTSTNRFTWQAAIKAVGGTIACADEIWKGKHKNGFAFVRPPGHHAERTHARGFCIFNNIAIAAEHLIRNRGAERIAIVDFDVHHGNGTQNAFYDRDDVFFISSHRYPFFPGSGAADEMGEGRGKGLTLNIPLVGGQGDDDFLRIYEKVMCKMQKYEPDIILVSAGYDAHVGDPLGGMRVTTDGFARVMRMIVDCASDVCEDRLLMVLEGGYDLKALRDSVEKQLEIMVEAS